jgi:hypothetical protein
MFAYLHSKTIIDCEDARNPYWARRKKMTPSCCNKNCHGKRYTLTVDHFTLSLRPLGTQTVITVIIKDKYINNMRWGRSSNISGVKQVDENERSFYFRGLQRLQKQVLSIMQEMLKQKFCKARRTRGGFLFEGWVAGDYRWKAIQLIKRKVRETILAVNLPEKDTCRCWEMKRSLSSHAAA